MNAPSPRRLAAVLPTDTWGRIRAVVERLRRQTIPEAIELVLVVPSAAEAGLDPRDLDGLDATIVEIGRIVPLARARAAGVRASRAPFVFLGETHSFPNAEFAEAVLAAAGRGWDVIVPRFENANPKRLSSCVGFLADYGDWAWSRGEGELRAFPIFNSVYRRERLLELGDRLEAALGHGDELVLRLRKSGARAGFAPEARLAHVNVTRPGAWIGERFGTGRLIGAARARRWTLGRRLAYAAGSPAIAGVLASRWLAGARRARAEAAAPRGTGAGIVVAAAVKAAGEAVGYLFGASPEVEERTDGYEIRKLSYAGRGER